MDLSGVIFVVLALAWAGYLIPKALRHHDEVARTRSVDRFSSAVRVLARREPVSRRDAELVVPSGRLAAHAPTAAEETPAPVRPRATPAMRRAARVAARRRRRVLLLLVLVDLVVGALAYLHYLRVWAPAVPVALTLGWLLLCRTQVRRERAKVWSREVEALAAQAHQPTAREVVRNEQGFEEVDPNEDTMTFRAEEVLVAVAVETSDGGSLWDPLPVTLPTYVSKPAAKRTVRTIDLTAPDAWTSGRTEQDAALVARAEAAGAAGPAAESSAPDPGTDEPEQRAVNS